MPFGANSSSGEYNHTWQDNDGATRNGFGEGSGAWVGWNWSGRPGKSNNILIPNWSPNKISIIQPYITVYFWRRTA